jgi:hypothetical protein
VVVGILATTRYMLNLRSEQHTRDLYESIYGEDMVGAQPHTPSEDYQALEKGEK